MTKASAEKSQPEFQLPPELDELREFLTSRDVEMVEIEYTPGLGDYRSGPDRDNESPETLKRTVITFRHDQELPADLPQGYGFMGGVARNVVLRELGEETMSPRDIDLVAISDLDPDLSLKDELSRRYMPDDYKHGYGVSEDDLAKYFSTRDFTLNELLIIGDRVYITPEGLKDLWVKVIRPTEYESQKWESYAFQEYGVHPRTAMKALRLKLEFEEMYGYGGIVGIEDWQWEYEGIPLFYLALALDKAVERGDALATRFYTKLIMLGTIDPEEHGGSLRDLALDIRYKMGETGCDPFVFKDESLNTSFVSESPQGSDEEVYDHYARLANQHIYGDRRFGKGFGEY